MMRGDKDAYRILVGKSLRKSATCKDNIKVEHGEIDLEDGDG
jgi:hypothetical protein